MAIKKEVKVVELPKLFHGDLEVVKPVVDGVRNAKTIQCICKDPQGNTTQAQIPTEVVKTKFKV